MPRYNKRIDPLGEDGLTRSQMAVARRWSEILEQLPQIAEAVEKGDFETLADKGELLARRADDLWREARAAKPGTDTRRRHPVRRLRPRHARLASRPRTAPPPPDTQLRCHDAPPRPCRQTQHTSD